MNPKYEIVKTYECVRCGSVHEKQIDVLGCCSIRVFMVGKAFKCTKCGKLWNLISTATDCCWLHWYKK